MIHTPFKRPLLALLLSLATASFAVAANDPDNPTSNSSEIMVLPAPGPVTIDGDDSDWDLSAGIWSYNDPTLVKKYSVWTHMMWDQKGVYLLMRYADVSPMKNNTRGEDFGKSWRADAFQGRVVFDAKTPEEHQMHMNAFYSSIENAPYLIVHHGGLKTQAPYDGTGPARPDQQEKYGTTMTAFGGKIAFKPWADGKGYNMEAFMPWSYLRTSAQSLKAGDSFLFGIEAMWGDTTGDRLEHRLVDNLTNDKVNRIFFFRARDGWGKAILSDKGHLAITEAQKKLQAERLKLFVNYDTAGSIPVHYTLPDDRDVTIAIDNAQGMRVRNLIGQFPRTKGEHTDYWDGLDDSGNPVAPGDYSARIVDHAPIAVKYSNSLYNSATPPWATATGRKLWGSNHGHPTTAATRGDVILLGFTGTEGASGLMRVDAEGKILWTDGTELLDLTLNDQYAFLISRESWTQRTMIRRLDLKTGAIALFDNEKRTTETVLPISTKEVLDTATIAYAGGKLFGLVPGKGFWRVAPNTGEIEAALPFANLLALENYNDKLWGLFTDGSIAKLDAEGKRTSTAFTAKGLKTPVRFAISLDGKRFAISDQGTNQVYLFDAKGQLVQTLGQPNTSGENKRPAGHFVETDFILPLGLSFDSQGRLWIAEAADSCRRVTCWSPEGKMDRQFWGAADYGATSGFPITFDSTRFIAFGTEFRLDPAPDVMNHATQEKPLTFHPALADRLRGFIYQYKGHEYATTMPGQKQDGFLIAKRNKEGVFVPVVRVKYGQPNAKPPKLGTAWIDKNDNGVEDPGETIEGVKGQCTYWAAGWITPDLTIVTADQQIYRLKELTATGVPIYDFQNAEAPKNPVVMNLGAQGSCGTIVMDKAGDLSNGIAFHTIDGRKGSYPNPFGRHDAPAARRGLLIAPFRTNGVIEDVPGVGAITALGGDRGEWFLMSMDGLYLSSLFQDSKGDVTLDETFIGQESFGGFIWRDEKGRVMAQLGGPSYLLVEITGLETTRKASLPLTVSAKQIEEGVQLAQKRTSGSSKEAETLNVAKVAKLPNTPVTPELDAKQPLIDGAETVRVQESGDPTRWFRVSLAHNGSNLAIAYQVNDSSPWKNGEGRITHAFIGGDAVDLKLDVPGRGPIRLLGASVGGSNTVVYWQKTAAQKENPTTYSVSNNEANAQRFDVVKRLSSAKITVNVGNGKYSVLILVPLADLGLEPGKQTEVKGIAGVIFSDPSGSNRTSRLYWHDKATGMVSDVPTEARLDGGAKWGSILIGK